MTKVTEYHVIAQSTPHSLYSPPDTELFMGSYTLWSGAKNRLQELRNSIDNGDYTPGYEPFFYYIKEVEVVRRGEEEIKGFGKLMQKKLDENKHKPGWDEDDMGLLFQRLKSETRELEGEVYGWELDASQRSRIALEAADVANYAMMIADVALGGDWDAV